VDLWGAFADVQPGSAGVADVTRIVVTDHAFADLEHERAAADRVGADFADHQCSEAQETIEAVRGAKVAFVNFAPIGPDQLAVMAPGATVIRYGVGVDNVDLEAARTHGVAVANVPDYGVDTVADHAAAHLLGLLRRIPTYDKGIRSEGWVRPPSVGPLRAFPRTTVGLVGAGRIARSLADRLRPFGFTVIATDPFVDEATAASHGCELVSLDDLVERSDAISLHVPVTTETYHLVGNDFLSRVRPGCVIVNTSRGALIDERALGAALSEGRVAGAGLDVFDPEPLALESPLRDCPGAVFTPHAAFYSDTSLDNLQRLAAEEAERAVRSEPLRCPVTTT
jgi:D-3-phosphoglycerate dehydrogenase